MELDHRRMGGGTGRRLPSVLPGLILFALVVITSVLLVAGYGVPVGVGLLAGLVIGIAGGFFAGLWLGVRGRGRHLSASGLNISSTDVSTAHDTSSFEMPEFFRDVMRVQRVDHGPLVRVIPSRAEARAGGVLVELIALEIRSAGAVCHLSAVADPPIGMLASFARVGVEDDQGTIYVAAATGNSGSAERSRLEVRFAPAPPASAAVLRIQIDEFLDPFPPRSSIAVAGPWSLAVDLTG